MSSPLFGEHTTAGAASRAARRQLPQLARRGRMHGVRTAAERSGFDMPLGQWRDKQVVLMEYRAASRIDRRTTPAKRTGGLGDSRTREYASCVDVWKHDMWQPTVGCILSCCGEVYAGRKDAAEVRRGPPKLWSESASENTCTIVAHVTTQDLGQGVGSVRREKGGGVGARWIRDGCKGAYAGGDEATATADHPDTPPRSLM